MSILLTRMQDFRAQSNLDKWETRASQYGAHNLFQKQTNVVGSIITEELKRRGQAAMGNTLATPMLDFKATTIGSTRPLTIAQNESDSAMKTITYSTYQFGFTMVPAQYTNNEVGYQQDFNHKLTLGINALNVSLDNAAITALGAAKTQVVNNLLGKYTFAANTLNAILSQKTRVLADITPIMGSNDFYMPRNIVGNPGLMSLFLEMQESGLYNDKNQAIQWADKELHFTNRLTDAANKIASGYIVNDASVGLLTRVDRDSLLNHETKSGYDWTVARLPGFEFDFGIMHYDNAADMSALHAGTSDLTATKTEAFSFSVDVAHVTSYNSDASTLPSPILLFDIDSDDTL